MSDAIQPISIKTRDILGQGNQHRRFVFNCFLIGQSGSGKSSLLDAIIKADYQNHQQATQNVVGGAANKTDNDIVEDDQNQNLSNNQNLRSVINAYTSGSNQNSLRNSMGPSISARAGNLNNGLQKFIIYTEIPDDQILEVLGDQELMSKCDCIALLYENERDHFDYIKEYINKLPKLVPKILI